MRSNDIGWVVDCSDPKDAVSLLKIRSSGVVKGVTIADRRLAFEVLVCMNPPNITLHTHGDAVSLKDIA